MSLVFVIVPAYNAEAYIQDCLDSLSGQSLTDWQAVVIDDGSTDRTLAVAQQVASREPRLRIETFPNGGVAAARNRGLACVPADARYVLLLDNDDFLTPDALETLVDSLAHDERAVAAYGPARFVDGQGQTQTGDISQAFGLVRYTVCGGKAALLAPDAPTTFASLVTISPILTPGQVLIRASVLRHVGEFDPSAVPADDWDMWLRLSSRGDFLFVHQFVLNKRRHEVNVSNDFHRMTRAELVVRRKLACSPLFSQEQWTIARIGHRIACDIQMGWAREAWTQRDIFLAIKRIYRGLRSYVWFLQTWAGRHPANAPKPRSLLRFSRER